MRGFAGVPKPAEAPDAMLLPLLFSAGFIELMKLDAFASTPSTARHSGSVGVTVPGSSVSPSDRVGLFVTVAVRLAVCVRSTRWTCVAVPVLTAFDGDSKTVLDGVVSVSETVVDSDFVCCLIVEVGAAVRENEVGKEAEPKERLDV